jgi:multisubunit Na+/H+ antiporter MnhF subunit
VSRRLRRTLAGAALLGLAVVLLWAVAARRPPLEGLIGLEVSGNTSAVALLLLSEGTGREAFADLALAVGLLSFVGALAFLRVLARIE